MTGRLVEMRSYHVADHGPNLDLLPHRNVQVINPFPTEINDRAIAESRDNRELQGNNCRAVRMP
jgi:hypothetical protein